MKKVLIISYHYLPLDVIASYRTQAYADHLYKHGFFPTIVTHRWEREKGNTYAFHEKGTEAIVEETESCKVIRLPRQPERLVKLEELNKTQRVLSKLQVLSCWVQGEFELHTRNSSRTFKAFIFEHLKQHHYDLIIGIFSPHSHLKLCYEIHQKFKIPYVLDFRDLWQNRVIYTDYSPDPKERIEDFLVERYWKKWVSKASFFTIASAPFRDRVAKITKVPGYVVKNGFESDILQGYTHKENTIFKVVHNGSVYHHQKLDIFLQGVKKFIEQVKPENFKVEFIGAIKEIARGKKSFNFDVEEQLADFLEPKHYSITKRIPRKEALQHVYDAQVVLFPAVPNYPGCYSGKIFEYLGAGKNILVVPTDHSVVEELILETQAGEICNTADEVASYLERKYQEWMQFNCCRYQGIPEKIKLYSREAQVKEMVALLQKYFNVEQVEELEESHN
jgi:hypothetical protein